MSDRSRILVLWNQVDEDVYELWRREGPRALPWDPTVVVEDVGTIAEELDQILDGLRAGGYDAELVNIRNDLPTLMRALNEHRPDAVFNLVEWFGDDMDHDAHIAGLYELMGVPYTGARPECLTLTQRKHRTKRVLRDAGLPTAAFIVVTGKDGDDRVPRDHGLRWPLIVKPAREDASNGIELASVVHDQAALEARVEKVLGELKMPVLIEEYIDGREIHCAILGNDPPLALPLFEMEFVDRRGPDGRPLPKIITYRAKWDPYSRDFYAMDARCPVPDLSPETVARIQDAAVRAYQQVGARDYARVDMRLSPTGELAILEVNPNPDLADGGAYMQCAAASGREYGATLCEIIGFALARKPVVVPSSGPGSPDTLLEEWRERMAVGDG